MRQRIPWFLIGVFFLASAVLAAVSVNGSPSSSLPAQSVYYRVCFADQCFRAEAAVTPEQRGRGLMSRTGLQEREAMIFFFEDEKPYPIWMKNMLFPIDILWLDSRQRIVEMRLEVPPCRADPCPVYAPSADSRYVLELKSGIVSKMGLETGDQMSIRLEEPADPR